MKHNSGTHIDREGRTFHCCEWIPDGPETPRAIVQIVHGMMEHAGRYDELAGHLTRAGYVVVAEDHYGHGRSAINERDVGHLEGIKGWDQVLGQIHAVREKALKRFPGIPFILLGHSMGAVLAFHYAIRDGNEPDGLVLSGLPHSPVWLLRTGSCLAGGSMLINGRHYRSRMINYLSYKVFNQAFKPARTLFDWLSRDEQEVDRYVSDPRCGFDSTSGFYRGFFYGMIGVRRQEMIRRLSSNLPVLILSGENDPVVHFGKGTSKLARRLKTLGLEQVCTQMYPGARHELFHETNRREVFDAMTRWLDEITS
jgi:alpha-beta hydrolase superfamily lysophospholipase